MQEVFTIGGGEYVVNVLNAVAAWCGGGGFRAMLRVVMVMGFAYSMLVVAFSMNWRVWFNWFISATLMYMCLIVPVTSVKVTDRLNPGLAPAVVDNVPVGLAAIAAFSSNIGDWMTRKAETVFVMPNELQYSTNGIIYGARLFDKTRLFEFKDPRVRANVEEYFKQCLFYDIMLGFKSSSDLADSTNILNDMGPGSPARAQRWLDESGGSSIKTCAAAYTQLHDQDIPGATDNALTRLAPSMFPNLSAAAAKAKLEQDLPIVTSSFFGGGQSGKEVFQQRSLVNAFLEARSNLGEGDGDTFAALRADAQARNTYTSIAQQAMTWVPLLNIVLTVVFYGMFPVIFPLFLMPQTGTAALKGYVAGFFYLAAWGPLYVILHMFIMGRTISAMHAASPGGVTMAGMSGIDAVNADTATIAGFLMMSVPFLAAGLARGALAVASNATSMLAPAQAAAEQAANERLTGNYSYGNMSYQNLTGNTVQRDNWRMAGSFEGGASSFTTRTNEGASITTNFDGAGSNDVFNTQGARSNLPFSVQADRSLVTSLRNAASNSFEQGRSFSEQASQSSGTSERHFTSGNHSQTSTSGFEARDTRGTQVANTNTVTNTNENRLGAENSTGVDDTTRRGASAKMGTGSTQNLQGTLGVKGGGSLTAGGGGAGGASANAGVDAAVSQSTTLSSTASTDEYGSSEKSKSASQRQTSSSSTSASNSAQQQNSSSAGNQETTSVGNQSSDSRGSGWEVSNERRQQFQRMADAKMSEGHMYQRMADEIESNGYRLTEDMTPFIQKRYEEMRQNHELPVNLPFIYKTNLSEGEREARDMAVGRIVKELSGERFKTFARENGLMRGELPTVEPRALDVPHLSGGGIAEDRQMQGPGSRPERFLGGAAEQGAIDGRPLARNAGVAIKAGARVGALDERMAPVMEAVSSAASRLDLPAPVITSGNDSNVHVRGSRHYDNQALDFRGHGMSVEQGHAWARDVGQHLGDGYRAHFEVFRDDPGRNHLHVQLTGER